jgi:hypothetical protein
LLIFGDSVKLGRETQLFRVEKRKQRKKESFWWSIELFKLYSEISVLRMFVLVLSFVLGSETFCDLVMVCSKIENIVVFYEF